MDKKELILLVGKHSDNILNIIENLDEFTQSDLQSAIEAQFTIFYQSINNPLK